MKYSAIRIFSLTLLLLLSAMVQSLAQAPVGTISGTIFDQSGAVITNASVIIRNKATGIERKVTSENDGSFSAASLAAVSSMAAESALKVLRGEPLAPGVCVNREVLSRTAR